MAKTLRGEIEAELGGVKRLLRLGIGDLEELEDRLSMGLPELVQTLAQGRYKLSQLREIVTAGLKGAGWKGSTEDVRSMIQEAGPGEIQLICVRLFNVALGNEDTLGKEDAEEEEKGNAAAPEGKSPPASPSGAISKSAVE